MPIRSRLALPVLAMWLTLSASCAEVDLAKAVSVVEVFSGWYDFGVVDGENKLVPSISFKLQNVSDAPLGRMSLLVSFWPQGADGELDSKEVVGIGSEALPAGQSAGPILVRSDIGYKTPGARAELFNHSLFKDFVVKVFAKRGGKFTPLGEFTVERRIIPQTTVGLVP
jgi:hypothetical protein